MLPQGLRHKQNGHRHPPLECGPSPREILRLVHSDTSRGDPQGALHQVVRFARVAQSEQLAALSAQAADEIDGLRSCLVETLDRTRVALARGEMDDVRRALDAFRARADLAADLVGRLAPPVRRRPLRHRLVDLNELVEGTVERRGPVGAGAGTPECRLDGALPLVHGSPRLLRRAVRALMGQPRRASEAPGAVVVETSHAEGLLRGEPIVRLRVTVTDAALPSTRRGVQVASGVAAEHGGVLVVERLSDRCVRFTVELPAA